MASESFMFDLTPDQQALVDDFMTNTYPNWKKVLDTTAANLGSINTGAAADWGKQKHMIGAAQTPVNFTLGGGNLATWVPYRTSMGNAIDKETAHKSAAANAPLAAEQAKTSFYADTVAPMQKQRMASLGTLGYVEVYNPSTKNSASVPTSLLPKLLSEGWQMGAPNSVQAYAKAAADRLDQAEPGLGDAVIGGLALVKSGVSTWKEFSESGLWEKAKGLLNMSDSDMAKAFDVQDYVDFSELTSGADYGADIM